jgi:hypothetical protein
MRTGRAKGPPLVFRPLTPRLIDELGMVLRGSWGSGCWCMYPRLTDAQTRALPGPGSVNQRRRDAMTKLARRRRAPGLIAFEGDEPVGWIAIAPRTDLARIETSRATPRVDDEDVWVIPCVTVHREQDGPWSRYRARPDRSGGGVCRRARRSCGRSIPARGCHAYGRLQCLLRDRAPLPSRGVRVIRKPLEDRPRNWVPRVAMRIRAAR